MLYDNKEKIAYVRLDNRVYEKNVEKYIRYFRKMCIKSKPEYIDIGLIIDVPEYKKYNQWIKKRIFEQVSSYIKEYNIDYIVFDNDLEFIMNNFDETKVLNGKLLMKGLIIEILNYIFEVNNKNMSLENIYVFVNQYTKSNIHIIKKLVEKFKTVNIITENLKYYKRLENSLYDEGILITVSNNIRKSARNAKYIINIDFCKELFENYNINIDSLIINLTDEVVLFEKKFGGVLVNNFEVCVDEDSAKFIEEFYGNIDKKIYLESILCTGKQYYEKAGDLFKQYNGKIRNLTGIRGVLQKCEFLM